MKLNAMMPRLQGSALKYLVIIVVMSLTYCSFKPKTHLTYDKMNAKKALIAAIEYFPDKDYQSIANYEISVTDDGKDWKVFFTQYKRHLYREDILQ